MRLRIAGTLRSGRKPRLAGRSFSLRESMLLGFPGMEGGCSRYCTWKPKNLLLLVRAWATSKCGRSPYKCRGRLDLTLGFHHQLNMAAARLRKAFRYPDDSDSDEPVEGIDEEGMCIKSVDESWLTAC
jgi:hypothetical protein